MRGLLEFSVAEHIPVAWENRDDSLLQPPDPVQAIIGNYAVPVLEEKQVWGTSDDTRTAYLDSQVALLKEPQGHSFANQALLSAYSPISMRWQCNSTCIASAKAVLPYPIGSSLNLWFAQDVAKMTLAALRSDATVNKTLTLSGPKAWTVPEVIELCEKLADERAQVTEVSTRSQWGPQSFISEPGSPEMAFRALFALIIG